ncbi:hypothetical protein KRIGEM_01484 [Komagataeibacter rhaeticus]|nr:hypothetical protein KRIGEM_01484 [Komagataeibacter rhaeticus]
MARGPVPALAAHALGRLRHAGEMMRLAPA